VDVGADEAERLLEEVPAAARVYTFGEVLDMVGNLGALPDGASEWRDWFEGYLEHMAAGGYVIGAPDPEPEPVPESAPGPLRPEDITAERIEARDGLGSVLVHHGTAPARPQDGGEWHFYEVPGYGTPAFQDDGGVVRAVTLDGNQYEALGRPRRLAATVRHQP
jgi:hypothetical protein